VFGFDFYTAHYFGAWVFIGGITVHVVVKFPHLWLACGPARCAPSCAPRSRHPPRAVPPDDPDSLVAVHPAPLRCPGAAARLVGGGALFVGLLTAGQTVGGPLRSIAILLHAGAPTVAARATSRSTAPRRPPRSPTHWSGRPGD